MALVSKDSLDRLFNELRSKSVLRNLDVVDVVH